MAGYGELVELGFEGVDKLTDKYHDKVYDHLPAWKKKQQRQEAQDQRAGQQQRQNQAPANEQQEYQQHSRRDSAAERNVNDREVNFDDDRDMSYGQSQAGSYAPRRQDPRDYQDDRDMRYQEEGAYRPPPPPNAGTIEMRDSEAYPPPPMGKFGGEVSRQAYPPVPPAYDNGYDDRRDRGRPAPSRMRSNSWSPPRNERHRGEDSRRRRRSRSRSIPPNDGTRNSRIAATILGGLVGGFAGNRAGKGQKYDTAATIAGAVLGGLASREIAEKVVDKQQGRKKERQSEEHAWEEKNGDGGRDDDYRRESRESRGWCDRCRSDRSRCRCR